MHEVRFPNIYILSHIYYIRPLTLIIPLAIKAVGFFAMHFGDIKDQIWFFLICVFYFRLKQLLLHVAWDEKKNTKNIEFISHFKYA